MKLSWKIMLSSILTFTITFATGGYLLISSFFSASLGREKDMAQEERLMLADRIFKEGKRVEAISFRLMDLIVMQEKENKESSSAIQILSLIAINEIGNGFQNLMDLPTPSDDKQDEIYNTAITQLKELENIGLLAKGGTKYVSPPFSENASPEIKEHLAYDSSNPDVFSHVWSVTLHGGDYSTNDENLTVYRTFFYNLYIDSETQKILYIAVFNDFETSWINNAQDLAEKYAEYLGLSVRKAEQSTNLSTKDNTQTLTINAEGYFTLYDDTDEEINIYISVNEENFFIIPIK